MKKSTYIMCAMVALGALIILGVIVTMRSCGEVRSNFTTVTEVGEDVEYSIPDFKSFTLSITHKINETDDDVCLSNQKLKIVIMSDSICEQPSLSIPSFLDGGFETNLDGDSLMVNVISNFSFYIIDGNVSPVITLRVPCDYDMSLINVKNVYGYTLEINNIETHSLTLKSNIINDLRAYNIRCDSLVLKSFRDVKLDNVITNYVKFYSHSMYDENQVDIEVDNNCNISHAVLTGEGSFNISGELQYDVEPFKGEKIFVTTEYSR